MPVVRIPSPLRAHTDGRGEVRADGATVGEVLAALEAAHPGLGDRLRDDQGRLHRFLNVFVGDDDVRELRGMDTPVDPDDVVALVPAVAGGASRPDGRPDGRRASSARP